MHWTDVVKRVFDNDTGVGVQISEEKPTRARAHVKRIFKHKVWSYKAYCEV